MHTVLIKHRGLRRALGAVLVGVGAVLMWLAPEVWSGVVLLVAGVALEVAGIALEHRNGRSRDDSHAVER
jgi:drug/metabolite transporter (DMT)-like permease